MGNTFDRIPIKEQARGIVSAQRSTCALACLVIALLALLLGGVIAALPLFALLKRSARLCWALAALWGALAVVLAVGFGT